ncbi:MAG: PP2C family protein-serine/threonine phosphatase, partial [Candidatus Acidiferrales bacterium]
VLFLRLEDRNAWLLALLFAAFISGGPLLTIEPAIRPELRGFALFYKILSNGMMPGLFYTFFAVFPEPSPLDRRLPRLKWALLAASAAVGLPLAVWGWIAGSSQPLLRLGGQLGGRFVGVTLTSFFIAGMGLGLVSLVWNGLSGTSPETRRKLRVIMWGTVGGLVPFLLLFAVSLQMNRNYYEFPFWVWAPTVLFTFLLPLSMAYAVVKHRVLAVPVLLKRSARYLLVRRSVDLLLLLLAVVFYEAAAQLVGVARETFVQVQPETTLISGVGIGMLFGAIFLVAHRTLQQRVGQRIDRAFFRSAYDARKILEDLAEKTRTATSREELATLLRRHIGDAFYPKARYVYLEDAQGRLAATSSGVPPELEVLPRDWPLLEELARHGRPWEVPPENRMVVATPFVHYALALQHLAALEPECLVPLLGRDQRLAGLLVIGQRMSEEPYSSEDKRLLASVAVQAATALEGIRLAEQMAERLEAERQAKREIEIALEVQTRLLPRKRPPIQTLDYVGRCIQARGVGGDYYDFLELDSNQTALVLTDIAGKGISAALLMANLQANLRSQYAVALDDLPRLLRSVNRLFCESTEAHHYATVFFGIYDDSTRRLRYENCGHNPPLLVGADGRIEHLKGTATVLGMFEAWECSVVETELRPGDLLVIYSDGVTEAMSDDGEFYGEPRLLDVIRANHERPVPELLEAIVADAVRFSGRVQEDDLTLIVARCR